MIDLSSSSVRAWPFEEARRIVARVANCPADKPVIFETGYGPSGLPHIGTFAEVLRTSWVRRAFEEITGRPTRLIAFSDDMDALRRVPDNVPNREMLNEHIRLPLCRVPDPFGTHESFSAHNNARLRDFLDEFGFDYEFRAASEQYSSGAFDASLLRVLERHEAVRAAVVSILGEERSLTYSPFLPIHPVTGQVMQVRVDATDVAAGTITWQDPSTGEHYCTPVTGGHCKLQWKADWGMRWHAIGVDYEMSGKDLIDSVKISSRVCRILGSEPPIGFTYELFLDENGEKISKSRGNGVSVEEWLRWGPRESLAYAMYSNPRAARKLYPRAIPRNTDDFLGHAERLRGQEGAAARENPAWHVLEGGSAPCPSSALSYGLLLNLAAVTNAADEHVLWSFVSAHCPEVQRGADPFLDQLVSTVFAYHRDVARGDRTPRSPTADEATALCELVDVLRTLDAGSTAEEIQFHTYEVGKHHYEPKALRSWFACLYEVLLGQPDGPRFGQFVSVYGLENTINLIDRVLQNISPQQPIPV